MSAQKYGIYVQTVELPQGGTISLATTNVDPISLTPRQREWLFAVIDLFNSTTYDSDVETIAPTPEPPDA